MSKETQTTNDEDTEDFTFFTCTTCEEEYELPEDTETCPMCGKKTLEEI